MAVGDRDERNMKTIPGIVTVIIYGEMRHHLPSPDGVSMTLCGLDGGFSDVPDSLGQQTVPTPSGARVDCRTCYAIWGTAQEFTLDVFCEAMRAS